MATGKPRKKRIPSFEVPEQVRRAGQSGWVYRSEVTPKTPPVAATPRRAARRPRPQVKHVTPAGAGSRQPPARPASPDGASWIFGLLDPAGMLRLGFRLMAAPFTLPLYVGSAILSRLGRR